MCFFADMFIINGIDKLQYVKNRYMYNVYTLFKLNKFYVISRLVAIYDNNSIEV